MRNKLEFVGPLADFLSRCSARIHRKRVLADEHKRPTRRTSMQSTDIYLKDRVTKSTLSRHAATTTTPLHVLDDEVLKYDRLLLASDNNATWYAHQFWYNLRKLRETFEFENGAKINNFQIILKLCDIQISVITVEFARTHFALYDLGQTSEIDQITYSCPHFSAVMMSVLSRSLGTTYSNRFLLWHIRRKCPKNAISGRLSKAVMSNFLKIQTFHCY